MIDFWFKIYTNEIFFYFVFAFYCLFVLTLALLHLNPTLATLEIRKRCTQWHYVPPCLCSLFCYFEMSWSTALECFSAIVLCELVFVCYKCFHVKMSQNNKKKKKTEETICCTAVCNILTFAYVSFFNNCCLLKH